MPVIDVEVVREHDEQRVPAAAVEALASEAGKIFETPPGRTWVKVRYVDRDEYWENDVPSLEGIHPIFVTVLKAKKPSVEQLRQEVDALSRAFAEILGRPQAHVHILYLPEAAGRIAFGGELVE